MGPPRTRTVEAGGFTTRYWECEPPGRPRGTVVLVHDGAFGGDAIGSWSDVMPLLAESHRVLAPDLLGYGDTDKVVYLDRPPYAFRAAHLAAFCAAVGVDTAHFVGQSFGGSLVLRSLATPSPALPALSGTSICGTGGPWRSAKGISELGRFDGTEQDVRRLVALTVDEYPGFDEAVRVRYANTRKPGHVQACLAARLRHPTLPNADGSGTWPAALRDCPVPTLVVEGTRDDLLESGWSRHFEGLSPLVRTHRMDARHAPNLDQPEEVAALLLAFFEESTR
ncbi:alpha/beta hydrolase [Micromonospora sp. NBRC 101691]|uniref:alpha/beta fold hydrolase n=1 Tax=Micromonospora sp. NBRC 101691 TaxID=3032198 RepID=UPI0024A0E2BF|nr:alpha/beta hydrolase [Micromonospora sp. NBRC 101691]GLY24148.1 alpha/beta hydrolase [Micromonospora sp. NBRC 101691]